MQLTSSRTLQADVEAVIICHCVVLGSYSNFESVAVSSAAVLCRNSSQRQLVATANTHTRRIAGHTLHTQLARYLSGVSHGRGRVRVL